MPKIKKKANIGIIGLGKFGMSLAIELATMGKNIVCLDKDEKKVNTYFELSLKMSMILSKLVIKYTPKLLVLMTIQEKLNSVSKI